MLITWTDDFPYFGTSKMVEWFEENVVVALPVKLEGPCEDFVAIQVRQNLGEKTLELHHTKYFSELAPAYEEELKGVRALVPMKPEVEEKLLELKVTGRGRV